jgi:L-alanine-DL-glutamate epimerase-like enolase superfamily enzyme
MRLRIVKLAVRPWELELRNPFTISLGTFHEARNVLVRVEVDTADGRRVQGYGEGAPTTLVAGETLEGTLAFLNQVIPMLEGREAEDLEGIHALLNRVSPRHFAGKAAIDLALHDAIARAGGVPLAGWLGGVTRPFPTDVTIGLGAPSAMADQAEREVAAGFRILKLKLGSTEAEDGERVDRVRTRVGPGIGLRLDANQGWTPLVALRIIERLEPLGIELVEQPVRAGDVRGLAEVASRSPVPIMADESVFTPEDAFRLADQQACHVFNIKLMKCGGLHPARKINAIGEAAHIRTFLGCMLESRLGIAAAAHFVAATGNVLGADLDAHLYFREDPLEGGPYVMQGEFRFPAGPGTGPVPRSL